MYRCTTLAYHCNARLIPFIVASSLPGLIIINWSKPAFIFQYSSTVLQNHTHRQGTCVNPRVYFFPNHAPISPGWIIMALSGQQFNHHLLNRGILHSVMPSVRYRARSSFYHSCSCMKPSADRKMSHQFPIDGKYCALRQCNGEFQNWVLLFPPQCILFSPD